MNIIRNHELIKKLDICTAACNFCFRLKPAQKPAEECVEARREAA